ncbi:MAG: choice-of-anchor J domain-containing protein [Crocinitomicaceae bacterium]
MLRIICSLSLLVSTLSFAQTTILFEDFTNGIPSNWAVVNQDGNTPEAAVAAFTDAWISYQTSTDTSAASTSFYTNGGAAQDYIILPKQSLLTHTKLSWEARSVDASYPDSYYVLISSTDSLIGSFTDTLLNVTDENYIWNRKSILLDTAGYANQDVYVAFCNYTTNGYILELDNVQVEVSDFTSIPTEEPISFSVYPNPTSETISISFDGEYTALVYAVDGQLIKESTEHTIDVSDLENGSYIIQLITEQQSSSQTFIKK